MQLASFNASNGNSTKGSKWAELREAQTATLQFPNTGMAVTTDIGNPMDIHPTNKQDVGSRLSAIALNTIYNKKRVFSGPVYKSMKTEGNQATLTFENIGSGLSTRDKYGFVKGFEVAGADKIFYYATAYIKNNKVIVFSDKVKNPIAVRFGWADDARDDNLYNKEEFPAGPFRTDDWEIIISSEKFRL
ncbi:sialate O-acetylesterase [Flavobacterium gillisiae]|uniref:Sialate O-acetylesterase n=1 Tax=Flavobacterium gillisiae TaxID=150146 RepID=A0A1H4F6L2_9FLAO|nr:hypothetical protein [Flavobacterium gillisiae]SEA92995.1 sialate O-acetylesterase [Flavobacterium gillisiae]